MRSIHDTVRRNGEQRRDRRSRRRVVVTLTVILILTGVVGLNAGGAQEDGRPTPAESSAEHEHDEHEVRDEHGEHEEHGGHEAHELHEDDADHHADHEGVHIDAVDLADGRRLHVAATTSIVGEVVSNVVGGAAEVTILMPIGQNPHAWEPTPSAMAAIETADIVFVNGRDLGRFAISPAGSGARSGTRQSRMMIPRSWLRRSGNVLSVFDETGAAPSSVRISVGGPGDLDA